MVGTGHTRERDVEIWVERPVEGKRGQKSVLGMTDDARKSCAPLSDLAGMGRGAEGLFEGVGGMMVVERGRTGNEICSLNGKIQLRPSPARNLLATDHCPHRHPSQRRRASVSSATTVLAMDTPGKCPK